MGQGYFTALAWGSLPQLTPSPHGDSRWDLLFNLATRDNPQGMTGHTGNEAEPEWVGYLIADGGYGMALFEDGLEDMARRTFTISTLAATVARLWPKRLADCKEAYSRLRARAAKQGIRLPPGQLLLVNDWD